MTIREMILEKELRMAQERLDKLKEFDAPAIMIECQGKLVKELADGILKIKGDTQYLDEVVTSYEVKTGMGGKPYIQFHDNIMYFPYARYGKYIKRQ